MSKTETVVRSYDDDNNLISESVTVVTTALPESPPETQVGMYL